MTKSCGCCSDKNNVFYQLPVLNYHGMESRAGEYAWQVGEKPYVLRFEDFQLQMKFLERNGYLAFSHEELALWFIGEMHAGAIHELPLLPIMITFDDGHISHFQHAMACLREHHLTATFFISANLVGQAGMMTWDHLKELLAGGFEIGSHGMNHLPLPSMTDAEVVCELTDSKHILEDRLGVPITSFSVPRGFYAPRIRRVAKDAGYRFVFTSYYGLNNQGQDALAIKRLAIKGDTPLSEFAEVIEGQFGAKQYFEVIKSAARDCLGPKIYDRLARLKATMENKK